MADRPRAVIDTNIIVRAVLRPDGLCGLVLDAFRARRFELITSEVLLEELVRVLLGPSIKRVATITEQQAAAIRANIEAEAVVVAGTHREVRVVPTDHADDWLFAAALEGRATHIVSGDEADVRPIKMWKPYEVAIQVVSPREFANQVLQLRPDQG